MSGEKTVAVYVRGDKVYVTPRTTGEGLRIDVEPVKVATLDAASIERALDDALAAAPTEPPRAITNLRSYRSPVLAAARARSVAGFERGTTYFEVSQAGGAIALQPHRPHESGRGFAPYGAKIEFPDPSRRADMVAAILRLALAERAGASRGEG